MMNICGVLVFIFISIAEVSCSWSNAADGNCKFTVDHDLDIRFEQNPLLFIDRLHSNDLSSCRQLCCDHNTCNGYVWSEEDPAREQCKLLKCSNEGTDCKNALTKNVVGKTNHEVGFITGIADPTNPRDAVLGSSNTNSTTTTAQTPQRSPPPPPPPPPLIQSVGNTSMALKTSSPRKGVEPTTITTHSSTQLSTQSSTSTTAVPIVNIRNDNLEGVETTTTTLRPSTVSTTQNKNVTHIRHGESHSLGRPTPHTASVMSNEKKLRWKALHTNSTRKGVIPKNNFNGHSDGISLTVALLFGLAFVLMSMFLVGKRWVESIRESRHRTGYTRISYLLNGV